MAMSKKLTFSLASLVVLIAFGLIFAPVSVMAHLVEDTDSATTADPDGTGYIQNHGANGTANDVAHPILDSVTAMGAAANGFVKSNTSFIVEFKFSGEAPTDFIATDITSSGVTTVVDFTTSADGLTFTARVTLNNNATITLADGNSDVTGLYVDTDNAKASVMITFDGDDPMLTADTMSEAKMLVVNGRRPAPPANGQWGPADFDIEFSLTDAGSGIDAGSIKIEDDQDPHVLSFSNIGETATPGVYAATVSTEDVDITADTDVVITITFSDKAGNEVSDETLEFALAAKTAGEEEEEEEEDDTGDDPLEDLVVPAKSYVIVAKTASPAGLPTGLSSEYCWFTDIQKSMGRYAEFGKPLL